MMHEKLKNENKTSDLEISVIIPTYNRAKTLPRAVETVLNQTISCLEIIIIDDGSTDNTADVVKRFGDDRIKYIRLDHNKGAPGARNVGLSVAKGEFIAFQDSDDEWHLDKLEKQVAVFKSAVENVGVVYSAVWRIKNGKKTYISGQMGLRGDGVLKRELLRCNFIDLPSSLVRKQCFSKVGFFDDELLCLEDWELWIRISECYKFVYLEEPLVDAYYSDDSISINFKKVPIYWEYILNKHYHKFSKYADLLAGLYYSWAKAYCTHGDFNKGKAYFLKAWKAKHSCKILPIFAIKSFYFIGWMVYKKLRYSLKHFKTY
jgi:glycosyltransferase involved in cell wall biosynthesis